MTISPSSTVSEMPLQGVDVAVVGVDVTELEESHGQALAGRAAAEVGLDDPGIGADLGGRALGDLLAVVEDRDPVADAHDDPHVVLDEQDREAEVVSGARG